jgi:hypothetical protein
MNIAFECSFVFLFAEDVAVEEIHVFKPAATNVAVEDFMSFSFLWM